MKQQSYHENLYETTDLTYYDRLSKVIALINECKEVPVFKIDGFYFKGSMSNAVEKYVDQNPSKKFIIWLQDNYKQLFEQ